MFSEKPNSKIFLARDVQEHRLTILNLLIWKNKFLWKSTTQFLEELVISTTRQPKFILCFYTSFEKE